MPEKKHFGIQNDRRFYCEQHRKELKKKIIFMDRILL